MFGIFLLSCVAVSVYVLNERTGSDPVRYRSTVSVRIEPKRVKPEESTAGKPAATTTTSPNTLLSAQQKFAMQPRILASVLRASGLPTRSPQIAFNTALKPEGDVLLLSVTAPTIGQTARVAQGWGLAYVRERRAASLMQDRQQKIYLIRRRNSLDSQLKEANRILSKLMPVIYREILRNNAPFGRQIDGRFGGEILTESAVPSNAPVAVVNLSYQRAALIEAVEDLSMKIAEINIAKQTPDVFAEIRSRTPPTRVGSTRSTVLPAGIGLLAGLLGAIAAAFVLDRLDGRIHTPEQAALAFHAPVLSVIPGGDLDFSVLEDPLSEVSQAYRGLAAASIATDRLPKAIMVSTPQGDAHEEVAANFAAALSRLGLKVALMATDANQAWFSGSFATPALGAAGFPELLARAHDGTLNGDLRDRLPTTDRAPNLVLVPPSEEEVLELPLEGLPLLLEALSESGVDIAVVAGPALLEHPDATIVAWVTRSVLWAVFSGEVTREDARAGAARLQLAGVTPFGVVMVGNGHTVAV